MLAMTILFLSMNSCSLLSYGSKQEAASKIKEGMTPEQVTALLGTPDFKRSESGVEQWEYRNAYYWQNSPVTVVIDFSGKRVVAYDSFPESERRQDVMVGGRPTPPVIAICPPSVSEADRRFEDLYRDIKNAPFKDEQLERLRREAVYGRFTCAQCARLLALLQWDDEKLEFLRILAPTIVDKYNGDLLTKQMTFDSAKKEARRLLEQAADSDPLLPVMDSGSFERFYAQVKGKMFKDEQLSLVRKKVKLVSFTCAQCTRLLRLFDWDDDRWAMLRIVVPVIADRQNDEQIVKCFESSFEKPKVRRMLDEYRVVPL